MTTSDALQRAKRPRKRTAVTHMAINLTVTVLFAVNWFVRAVRTTTR